MKRGMTLLLLVAACFLLRLAYLGRYPEGWDSVNFLLALRRYDVAAGQPHFPGYPVYLFAGEVFQRLLRDEVTSLLVAGCLVSSLTLVPLYRLSARLYSPRVATAASALFVANPLIFLESEKLFSDAFALFFVVAAVDLTEEAVRMQGSAAGAALRTGYLAGLAAGLMLGVRVSALPFLLSAAVWLWRSARHSPRGAPLCSAFHGLIHGTGAWLIPLLALTGARPLIAAGTGHLHGHFSQWGETAVTHADPLARLREFLWTLGPNGLGTWWPDTPAPRLVTTLLVIVAIASYLAVYRREYPTRFLLIFALPYAAWVFFGQNLQNPRHVLPLVALSLPALAAGLLALARGLSYRFGTLLCALFAAAWLLTALPLVAENRRVPPTRIALVSFLRESYRPHRTAVVCWNSARIFDYAAPEWSWRVAPSVEEGLRLAGRSGTVLVLSDLPDFEAVRHAWPLRPVRTFRRGRYVHNYLHEVTLYALERPSAVQEGSSPNGRN